MNRSSIDWCDYTFNPITGCKHGCEYCYAAKMVKRFSGDVRLNLADPRCIKAGDGIYELDEKFDSLVYPFGFAPTLHVYRLKEESGKLGKLKEPANIFVGAMADIFGQWVPDEWIQRVFDVCKEHPQHRYLFLTKNPQRYIDLQSKDLLPENENFWYGTTVTTNDSLYFWSDRHKTFLSIEPILSRFHGSKQIGADWVIVGAMTGTGSKPYQPERKWIEEIQSMCAEQGIPLFMKKSLRTLMGDDYITQYPPELTEKGLSPKNLQRRTTKCSACGATSLKSDLITISCRANTRGSSYVKGWLCEGCLKSRIEQPAVKKSIESALKHRRSAFCMVCGERYSKREMKGYFFQRKRGMSAEMLGYICKNCEEK